jgi:uncharacterized lipoprotein YddW (UPF0748 family)
VAGCHERGLELHAWFNPYRARHPSASAPLAASHVANRDPAIVKAYGEWLWLDPGEPRAAQRIRRRGARRRAPLRHRRRAHRRLLLPLPRSRHHARRAAGSELPFPDDASYQTYRAAGGGLARADWRRDNVDR